MPTTVYFDSFVKTKNSVQYKGTTGFQKSKRKSEMAKIQPLNRGYVRYHRIIKHSMGEKASRTRRTGRWDAEELKKHNTCLSQGRLYGEKKNLGDLGNKGKT